MNPVRTFHLLCGVCESLLFSSNSCASISMSTIIPTVKYILLGFTFSLYEYILISFCSVPSFRSTYILYLLAYVCSTR
jgi:hypothetical protein